MFQIVQKRKIWYAVSVIILVASLVFLAVWGLKFGIDFTGGSILELQFSQNNPDLNRVTKAIEAAEVKGAVIQLAGDNTIIIRSESLTEDIHQAVLGKIKAEFSADQLTITETRFDSIGSVIGNEMKQKTIWAIILVLLAIIIYIGFSFRKVSFPVPSWKFGVTAIIALFHDLILTIGFYAVLVKFAGAEVDSLFIMALLTVLGFSIHDTIVTFDRIRENLVRRRDQTFENIVNISINETIVRSINTSLTAVLALTAIFLFGGASVHFLAATLIFGIIAGTYSSIFIASQLLVTWHHWSLKKKS